MGDSNEDSWSEGTGGSIREGCRRQQRTNKSQFAILSHETQQYQKMVADLEGLLLNDAAWGESPEAAWRARILVGSAQEADAALGSKLREYCERCERTAAAAVLGQQRNSAERQRRSYSGTASAGHHLTMMGCRKLLRDYERSRQALARCLSLHGQRQRAEISQLMAVQHDNDGAGVDEPDYFDRAVRQRELELIQQKMHTVNGIYRDLAGLVEQQQQPIDQLEREVGDAKDNVEAGADEIHCLHGRREGGGYVMMCGAMEMDSYDPPSCGVDNIMMMNSNHWGTTVDHTVSFSDDKPYGVRVTEDFHWRMPLETMQEDVLSVRNDLFDVGKSILQWGTTAAASVVL